MEKKYGIFYNQQFDIFMVALNATNQIEKVETQGDVTILKNGDEVIGINLLSHNNLVPPKMSFCSENPRIVNYIEEKLKPFILLKQQPQFIIGKIMTAKPIPNTHLQICEVDIKTQQPLAIICGAANAKVGLLGVVATCGAWLPSSQVITPKTIMGYETNGMLCSAQELGLEKHHFNKKGIIELPRGYQSKLGMSFWGEYYAKKTKISF